EASRNRLDRDRHRRRGGSTPDTTDRRSRRGPSACRAGSAGDGAASIGVRHVGDRSACERRQAMIRRAWRYLTRKRGALHAAFSPSLGSSAPQPRVRGPLHATPTTGDITGLPPTPHMSDDDDQFPTEGAAPGDGAVLDDAGALEGAEASDTDEGQRALTE